MLKLLDGFVSNAEGDTLVFSLDVTELSENSRLQTLADMRIIYPNARFLWHDCYHDIQEKCSTVVV